VIRLPPLRGFASALCAFALKMRSVRRIPSERSKSEVMKLQGVEEAGEADFA